MTKPTKIQAKHHPAAKTVTVIRQSRPEKPINSAKKAPAPPPNPALVNPQNSSSEAKSPQVNQVPQQSYDKHTDGALTYFNYYFEELTTPSTRADYPEPSTRSKIPVGVLGAGVVAATIASGAMIGEALHQPEAPQSSDPQDAAVKQNADSPSPRPTTTTPEKLEIGRSLSSSPTGSAATKTPAKQQPAPALKRIQSTSASLTTSGSLVSNSPPLKLSPLSLNPTRSTPGNPTNSGQSSNSGTASHLLQNSAQPTIGRQITNPSAVAPPETLPASGAFPGMSGSATPTPTNSSESTAAETGVTQSVTPSSQSPSQAVNPQTTPFPPAATPNTPVSGSPAPAPQSPYLPVSTQGGTDAAVSNSVQPSEVTDAGAHSTVNTSDSLNRPAIPGQSGSAPGDRLLETGNSALNRFTPTTTAAASPTITAQAPLASNFSEGIQDYLNRSPKPTAQAPALMPLSSKAAGEAVATPQIGTFTVRQVNQQDYQKEWQTSNRNPSDPAIAYAFPAYGFIDYQRQVIIVLKEQPDVNPLQSQQTTTPNS